MINKWTINALVDSDLQYKFTIMAQIRNRTIGEYVAKLIAEEVAAEYTNTVSRLDSVGGQGDEAPIRPDRSRRIAKK